MTYFSNCFPRDTLSKVHVNKAPLTKGLTMLRATMATLTAPLALAALTGCGAQAAAKDDGFAVPAGVQKQYEVLANELAEKGKTVESGEWTVNLITEAAEPWFDSHGAHFR